MIVIPLQEHAKKFATKFARKVRRGVCVKTNKIRELILSKSSVI